MMNILIIDDDEDMCEEMKDILESENYSVDACNDGETGIRSVEKNTYDIVLLDLKMPKMNGYEVLRCLKDKYPALKMLVLTGSPLLGESFSRAGKGSLKNGGYDKKVLELADGIINKPFDVPEVLLIIKKLIERD